MEEPDLHAHDAKFILDLCRTELGWGDLSEDVIMDIGCGRERNCCETLIALFPTVRRVIAIDKDPATVRDNSARNKTPQIEYAIADVEKSDTLERWENITKVISSHCFHQLNDKELGFQNVYGLLKHEGQAGFFFAIRSGLYEWCREMSVQPKWKPYIKHEGTIPSNLYPKTITVGTYKEMLERIGFTVVYCKEKIRILPYPSDHECRDNLYTFMRAAYTVPDELREEFKDCLLQVFLKHNSRNEEGKICYRSVDVAILVKKPDESSE